MRERIISIGEILFDVYPDYKKLGGAPFNFSYHLFRFGMDVAFISRIGNDIWGKEIIERLNTHQFPTNYIQRDDIHPTGNVLVRLNDEHIPDYNITGNVAYDFIDKQIAAASFDRGMPGLLYFGTLAQRNPVTYQAIYALLDKSKKINNTLIFCDVNLRQKFYSKELLETTLQEADIVKINDDELKVIQNFFDCPPLEEEACNFLLKQFGLTYLCLTHGERGSVLYTNGIRYEAIVPNSERPVVDSVGAGDAYSAILALGILKNMPPRQVVDLASRFALTVCTIPGAIPSAKDKEFYEPFLSLIKNV